MVADFSFLGYKETLHWTASIRDSNTLYIFIIWKALRSLKSQIVNEWEESKKSYIFWKNAVCGQLKGEMKNKGKESKNEGK